jgi:tripartite-type tricarboxylate transporter receptor subunit TctC
MTTRPLRQLLAGLAVAFCSTASLAQGFPDRPVTMIVPFPPGGVADQSGRPMATAMEKVLKQPVVVSNRPGAGGAVGMAATANAKPDGYTIMTALSSISIIPEADKLFDRQPAYRLDQFTPIALITADPTVLVVPAEMPWKSVADFVADAKKRPNEIGFSSSGVYGTLHMAMAMFATAADIKLKHVPYAGGGPALTALLGNHVQALASGPGPVMPQVQAGKLRVLATWGSERLKALPDVPTFMELGYKDVEFYIWAGVYAPVGVPAPALQKLQEAARAASKDPEFHKALENLQTPLVYKEGAEFKAFADADAKRMEKAVKAVGKVQ